jgi:DNA primase large subunit
MLPCRLLRNRVSAQQARERKKSYVSNLEQQAKGNEQTVCSCTQLHGNPITIRSCTVMHLCTVIAMPLALHTRCRLDLTGFDTARMDI